MNRIFYQDKCLDNSLIKSFKPTLFDLRLGVDLWNSWQ